MDKPYQQCIQEGGYTLVPSINIEMMSSMYIDLFTNLLTISGSLSRFLVFRIYVYGTGIGLMCVTQLEVDHSSESLRKCIV